MKRTNRILQSLGVIAVAISASACGESTGLAVLDDEMVMDAALLAADATLEEVTMWSQPFGFGIAPAPGANDPIQPTGRPGGLGDWSGEFSGTRAVTFYDAAGDEMDAYDALVTASINFVREIEGSIVRENFTAEIVRERDMTVSGLEGEETTRTWNGDGSSNVARAGVLEDGTERSHTVEGSFEFDDVIVPIPGSDSRFPLSGSITRSLTVTRVTPDGTVTREVTVVVTFDGTEIAMVTVNGEAMEIDLSVRDGRNPLRRRRG